MEVKTFDERLGRVLDVRRKSRAAHAHKPRVLNARKQALPRTVDKLWQRLGKLPADVGVVVGNVHTAFSLFDAVENGTPLYRRALTVCGGSAVKPSNLWVRTGTTYAGDADTVFIVQAP